MSVYLDTSALLKRYVEEAESVLVEATMLADTTWITAQHTFVEVRRNLARVLRDRSLGQAKEFFERDWQRTHVVQLDDDTCRSAAEIAELTGTRTLDALHLAALRRAGEGVALVTFDLRQAAAARTLGFRVIGG